MKQKHLVKVKSGVKYLSEIPNFELPNGVLNKDVTGCGATTVALVDKHPTIICCPRVQLLKNKSDQYLDSLLVIAGVYADEINKYIQNAKIPKILVSYDSFNKLLDCIVDKTKFRVVIDEFHLILQDASFKSEVGLSLLNNLKKFPYVTYLSATPILDEFIDKISFFDNIPYYKLEWEDKESIQVISTKHPNPISAVIRIVKKYQAEDYPKVQLVTGDVVESQECVIFLNSVKNIANIVKQCKLTPEDVNFVVGTSEDNDKLISQIGKGFHKGRIPLKGEKHKKITFCTSTAYAGCDFYSECASTFVISDNRRLNTTIDISTDLVQIAGRQRLEANPFRKHIHFFYNTSIKEATDEQFSQYVNSKVTTTKMEIESNNSAVGELKKLRIKNNKSTQIMQKYSETYTLYDESQDKFILNELAYLNEIYSYSIQRHNYKSGIFVKNELQGVGFSVVHPQQWVIYDEKVLSMILAETFEDKMKKYIEIKESGIMGYNIAASKLARSNPQLQEYYDILGCEKIKALNYIEARLKRAVSNLNKLEQCYSIISKDININKFISSKDAKEIVANAYSTCGITKTAVGTDLSYWYKLKVKTARIDGNPVKGFIILSKIN